MAKHAHRLILNQKKTWRCTLVGCSYFIHVGLDHILASKRMKCCECNEEFTVIQYDVDAAKSGNDRLECSSCKASARVGVSKDDFNVLEETIDLKMYLLKHHGTNKINEVPADRIKSLVLMGVTTQRAVDAMHEMELPTEESVEEKPTIIHVEKSEHRDDCASLYIPGLECDCKDGF